MKLTTEGLVKLFIGGVRRGNCPRLSHNRSKMRTKKVEHKFEE